MKTTIKATLQAMGEVELRDSAGDPIVYRRGILLMCETDADVRAFAPLMGKGAVELRVETVEDEPSDAGSGLEPCPFCGSTDLELCHTHTACYWVECLDCMAQVRGEAFGTDQYKAPPEDHGRAKTSAIEAWNMRDGKQ